MTTLKGQCLCGTIQYEVDQLEEHMGHCHCSMCRKFHGAAFATFGEAKRENFRWVEGEESLKSYQGVNGTTRQFCQHCGSSMTFAAANDDGKFIEFSLGTLDSPIEIKPDVHIFVGSKADWMDIVDDLPQFEAGRDSLRIE